MKDHNYAVIMAGGVGSRFWPVSTQDKPKQFQDILGSGQSLIQTTYSRLLALFPKENILVLTNIRYRALIEEQLPDVTNEQIVMEPVMRNTAPCILLAAFKIWKRDPEARMLVAPSDHWIPNQAKFLKDVRTAFKSLEELNQIVTFGIQPTSPNTGYGYIEYPEDFTFKISPVSRFTEKPDLETAKAFLEKGNYLWNSGIFVWKAAHILECFDRFLPEMYRLFKQGLDFYNTNTEQDFILQNFEKAETISIDYGIIEKARKVGVIHASFSWNDLGTWGSIQQEVPKDSLDNTVVNTRLLPQQATGNIVRTQKQKIVILDGLQDFLVLEDAEVLIIVPKSRQQEIKDIRMQVMQKFGEHLG